MQNHLYYIHRDKSQIYDDRILLKDLVWLVRLETKIDEQINHNFPLSDYGEPQEVLLVYGAKSLMLALETVHAEKYDFVEALENIEVIGFMPNSQIVLLFKKILGIWFFSILGICLINFQALRNNFGW